MTALTQPLREEHAELIPHIEAIRRVADAVSVIPLPRLREQVDEVHGFLTGHLIPHAKAEDVALYPVVASAMGAPEATATMSREHEEVADLTDQLKALEPELSGELLAPDVERALRRILYGLYELVKVHFDEEEEIYLPILDEKLTEAEAREMFEAMEEVAAKVKAQL